MMNNTTKRVAAATIGTILEWAEYSFYGYLAVKISGLFFPKEDPVVALISAFGIFAAGFLMRPLGGIFFGHMGDRIGRKKTLVFSIYLMAFATIGIGLLPTYEQIGILAPVLLLLLRLVQGLAVAGEFNGASIFLIEHANPKTAYLSGSWSGTASAAGMLLGALMALIVTLPQMPPWAWRIPFFLGFLGCLAALYLRKNVSETPEFVKAQSQNKLVKAPIITAFKQHKLSMLQVGSLAAFIGVWIYLCNLYYKAFLIQAVGISAQEAGWLTTFGQCLVVIFFPMMGALADKIGGEKIMWVGLIGAIISAPFIFWAGMTQTVFLIGIGQALYAFCNAAVGAPMFKYLFDRFPTAVRYSGTSFAWSLSVALFGGTAPMLAQYWVGTLHWLYAPPLYIALVSVLALGVLKKSLPIQNKDSKKIFANSY